MWTLILAFLPLVACQNVTNDTDRYLRGNKDPFKLGMGCRPKIVHTAHFIPDPQYCDRFMFCNVGEKIGIAFYCPAGYIYDEKTKKCLDANIGQNSCTERGSKLVTPFKPERKCNEDEPVKIYRNAPDGEGYFKMGDTKYSFYLCVKDMEMATIVECLDPLKPEIDLDSPGIHKCFPKGHLAQKKFAREHEAAKIAAEEFSAESEDGEEADYFVKDRIFLNSGLFIRFNQMDEPMCPTKEKLIAMFKFGSHVRIQHNKKCANYWTCNPNGSAMLHSCHYMDVFNPITGECTFYEQGLAPCDHLYKNESTALHILARARHRSRSETRGLDNLGTVESFYYSRVRNLAMRMGGLEAEYGKNSSAVKSLQEQMDLWKNEAKSLRFKYVITKDFGSVMNRTKPARVQRFAKLFEDERKSAIPNFAVMINETHGQCPPVALKKGVKPEDVDARYDLSAYYETTSLAFGKHNRLAIAGQCGHFLYCDFESEVNGRIGVRMDCHNNKVFLPPIYYYQNNRTHVVPDTGICVDNKLVHVPGCEHYESFNPLTTNEKDFSRLPLGSSEKYYNFLDLQKMLRERKINAEYNQTFDYYDGFENVPDHDYSDEEYIVEEHSFVVNDENAEYEDEEAIAEDSHGPVEFSDELMENAEVKFEHFEAKLDAELDAQFEAGTLDQFEAGILDQFEAEIEDEKVDQAEAEIEDEKVDQAEAEIEDVKVDQAEAEIEDVKVDQAEAEIEDVKVDQTEVETEDVKVDQTEVETEDVKVDQTEVETEDVKVVQPEAEIEDVKVDQAEAETEDVEVDQPEAEIEDVKIEQPEAEIENGDFKFQKFEDGIVDRPEAETEDEMVDETRAEIEGAKVSLSETEIEDELLPEDEVKIKVSEGKKDKIEDVAEKDAILEDSQFNSQLPHESSDDVVANTEIVEGSNRDFAF